MGGVQEGGGQAHTKAHPAITSPPAAAPHARLSHLPPLAPCCPSLKHRWEEAHSPDSRLPLLLCYSPSPIVHPFCFGGSFQNTVGLVPSLRWLLKNLRRELKALLPGLSASTIAPIDGDPEVTPECWAARLGRPCHCLSTCCFFCPLCLSPPAEGLPAFPSLVLQHI